MLKSFAFLLTFAVASAANAMVIGVIDPQGNTTSNATTAANTLEPSTIVTTNTAAVNGATAASLKASYDVLIFSWYGGSYSSTFWTDTLLGYIQMGGGVIFDGASSATSAMNGSGLSFFGSSTFSSGAQTVTDNAITSATTVHGANHHLGGLSGNSDWTEFLSHSTTTLGMYASFGAGRIIATSTDFFYHGHTTADMSFMVDELTWVTSASVPEPMPLALLALGLIGLAYSRKRA